MTYSVEDLDDQERFRLILTISYKDLIPFILEYLKKKSGLTILYWATCLAFLLISVFIRIKIAGYYPVSQILMHSLAGFVILPLLFIPVHELLHIIPYYLSGAKDIRVGMDLKQYLFYVSANRYVASPVQFRVVAITPFILISSGVILTVIFLPNLWKWSMMLFLFVHATMCAGDIALLNFYRVNDHKRIYTWDDVDNKEAYFYEKLEI